MQTNKIKEFRIARGFKTIASFAEFIKVTPECVGQWERQTRQPARKYRNLIRKKFRDITDEQAWDLFFGGARKVEK